MLRAVAMLGLGALLGVSACGSCEPTAPTGEATKTKPSLAADVVQLGVIEGTVRLAQDTELPELLPSMMYVQVLQQTDPLPLPAVCTPAKQVDRRPVQLTNDRLLSSVFIAASDFKTQVHREPKVHEVSINDCRLTPMVIGAMRGDTLKIASDTDYPFMPQLGGTSFFETMIKGQTRTHKLEALGPQSVVCGFTAPCGRTDVITVAHPLFALSDAQGHFRIEGVPANEPINFNAWHPLFRASTQSITLAPGETKQIEFVLTPEAQYTPSGQAETRRREEEARKGIVPGSRPE